MTWPMGSCAVVLLSSVVVVVTTASAAARASIPIGASPDTTVVISNPESGSWAPGDEWMIEQEWRIGEVDSSQPELLFDNLRNIGVGPNGEIAAVSFGGQHVRLFDRDGRFLYEVGGPGQGPGEFQGPLAVGWDSPGRMWVPDGWNGRYSVFDSDGTLVRTIPRALAVSRFSQDLVFLDTGEFVDEAGLGGGVGLVRVDTTGTPLDTLHLAIPEFPHDQALPGQLSGVRDFIPRLAWTVAPDGTVWTASPAGDEIVQQSLGGDTLLVIRNSHREPIPTRTDEAAIARELAEAGLDASQFEFVRQLVRGVYVLEDGHVVLLIQEPGSDQSDPEFFDVIDPEGRFLGSIETQLGLGGGPEFVVAFRENVLAGVVRDEWGVQYVVRATVRRPER